MDPEMAEEFNLKMAARMDAVVSGQPDLEIYEVVEALYEELQQSDPELLHGWLQANALQFLSETIRQRFHSDRSRHRNARRKAFGDAADSGTLADYFEQRFVVNEKNTWRRLGDMTGADHRYVAGQHECTAKRAALLAKFHLAVARKVGTRRTEEVFSAEKLAKLEQSITGV